MKNLLLSKILLLTLCIALVGANYSCDDNSDWDPTWAIPLIRQTELKVEKFLQSSEKKVFTESLSKIWQDAITNQDPAAVNTLAYNILTDTTQSLALVEYKDSVPNLKNDVADRLQLSSADIAIINNFLKPATIENPSSQSSDVVSILLSGLSNSSEDIFIFAGNFANSLPDKLPSVNKKLQTLLSNVEMQDSLEFALTDLVGSADNVSYAVFDMDMNSTLPFDINIDVNFSTKDKVEIPLFKCSVLSNSRNLLTQEYKKLEVKEVINNGTGLLLKADIALKDDLYAKNIKTLGIQGISYNFRIKTNAKIKIEN
ncbi:MAG: hypothetical protein ACRCZB_10100 [Bacteroidales bacterium]